MSSQALVVLGQTDLQKGGQGVDFTSKFAKLDPATLNIVQNMSDAVNEGVPPGMLYIKDTKQSFKEMRVTLLSIPKEQRKYHVGEQKSKDTLMCYSYDMVKPDPNSPDIQAVTCNGCDQQNWTPWRESSLPNAQKRHLIPKCEVEYYAQFIDTVYKLPLQMWVKGASKAPFEAAMKNVFRTIYMMKSQGLNPNIYDVSFKLTSVPGTQKNHVFAASDFKALSAEDREQFGDVFLNFVNRAAQYNLQKEQEAAEVEVQTEIASEVTEPGTIEGEYVI